MFDDIGDKIKVVAMSACWIGIIIFIIFGICIMTITESIFIGLILIAIGALVSWLSSLTLYGFGEIIEHLNDIRESVYMKESPKHESLFNDKPIFTDNSVKIKNGEWRCTCGRINASYTGTCGCGKVRP